jgi:hypothetical protein
MFSPDRGSAGEIGYHLIVAIHISLIRVIECHCHGDIASVRYDDPP